MEFPTCVLKGNLTLTSYPETVSQLRTFLESSAKAKQGFLTFDCRWIDLTTLARLAIELREWRERLTELTVHFKEKSNFFVNSGFTSAVQLNRAESPFRNSSLNSAGGAGTVNGTSLEFVPLDSLRNLSHASRAEEISTICKLHLNKLSSLVVYPYVANAELLSTRDYLSVVLWELLDNAIEHSNGSTAIFASQIFYDNTIEIGKSSIRLGDQYSAEINFSPLNNRANWIDSHRGSPFLQISCVDRGIGILKSLESKGTLGNLLNAFSRHTSRSNRYESGYAVHGLHLIGDLVERTNGYLFVGANDAFLEITSQGRIESKPSKHCPGTVFQVLLPLDVKVHYASRSPRIRNEASVAPPNVIRAVEIARKHTFTLPPEGPQVKTVVESIVNSLIGSNARYLDFVGMPRERHFTSHLIAMVRKAVPSVVATINVSEDLFSAIADVRNLASQDSPVRIADAELSNARTRGDVGTEMPLIVPVSKLDLPNRTVTVQWLGLGSLPLDSAQAIKNILDELFHSDSPLSEEELAFRTQHSKGRISQLLKRISIANVNLLCLGKSGWSLSFSASDIYYDSVHGLEQELQTAIRIAKLPNHQGCTYYLPWRSEDTAYISDFYSLWKVLAVDSNARSAASLLLAKANSYSEPVLENVVAVVSATPSSGLLAREVARTLRIPHWETWSINDLENAEWPDSFDNQQLLIVDDLIDTGTTTSILEKHVTERKGRVAAVLAFVSTKDGRADRAAIKPPIFTVTEIDLKRVQRKQTSQKSILEIDINTLRPYRQIATRRKTGAHESQRKASLYRLAECGALRSGHFVYSSHHYDLFFDIAHLINNKEAYNELESWFWDTISTWLKNTTQPDEDGHPKTISLIYPYFSPIAAFLHELNAHRNPQRPCAISIHVAQPFRRSQGRVGYYLTQPEAISRLAVFVDDGVASGGTMASIIDEFISIAPNTIKHLMALVIFDRIGMTARRQLKSIAKYRPNVEFQFASKYSVSLNSYFRESCPLCRIIADIQRILRQQEERLNAISPFRKSIEATVKSLSPTYVSAIATKSERPELSLFRTEDIKAIAYARDVMYSDQASGKGIVESLTNTGKSAAARLELFLTVAGDALLLNSIHEKNAFDFVPGLFFDARIDNAFRSWFLLHLPYLCRTSLSKSILTDKIPSSLVKKLKGPLGTTISFNEYLDEHPSFLSSLTCAIRILAERLAKEGSAQSLLDLGHSWSKLIQEQAPSYEYLFKAGLLDKELDFAIGQAEMLVVNFLAQFARHDEALINQFKKSIPSIKQCIPSFVRPHVFSFVFSAVRKVTSFYELQEFFPESLISELELAHDRYSTSLNAPSEADRKSASESFINALSKCFPIGSKTRDTNIEQLLEQCAPSIDRVINSAKQLTETYLSSEHWTIDAISPHSLKCQKRNMRCEISLPVKPVHERAFASKSFLEVTVGHLIRNPIENYERSSEQWRGKPLCIALTTESNDTGVSISVTSNQQFTQSRVDSMMNMWGGLHAQKGTIEKWGGRLNAVADDTTVTFTLSARKVRTEKKNENPVH